VDEKYYLPDDRIEKILNSTFMQEKKRIQTTDVCDTLLARDWKDPKCVPIEELEPIRLGGLYDSEDGRHQAGAIWDKDAISPTLDTMQGGNRQPFIIDEIKVVGNYMPSNHDASRIVDIDGIAPTVKENHGTVTAIAEPFIVASRGRNPENPSDRTTGAPTEQRLEPNYSGCTNTLTSVQKDNYVCEPQVLRAERTEYGKSIRKQYEAGEVDEKIGNMREMKPRTDGVANTITTLLKDNYVAEPQVINVGNIYPSNGQNGNVYDVDGISPTINAGTGVKGNGIGSNNAPKVIVAESQTEKNLWTETQKKMITADGNVKRYIDSDIVDEFNVGDCADISFPNGYNKANRVFDGYSPAINGTTTQSSFIVKEPIVYDDYNSRISADQDAINTLTCNCGASAERNGVKIIEPVIVEDFYQSREPRVYTETAPTIRSERVGLKAADGEIEYPCSTRGKQVASAIRASIYKQGSRNLEENVVNGLGYEGVIEQEEPKIRWRIRKLTDKECWRLMNFTDSDNDRASKYVSASSLYKQAGNSIVVACLIALMSSMFIEDGHKAEVWTKYVLHFYD
jgi:hypothetical protein